MTPKLSTERLRELMRQMGTVAADPMWDGHVELSKERLKWWILTIREVLREAETPAEAGAGWRTMDSAPKDTRAEFWLDWAPDCAPLNPALDRISPMRLYVGTRGCWPSVYAATHWRPVQGPYAAPPFSTLPEVSKS